MQIILTATRFLLAIVSPSDTLFSNRPRNTTSLLLHQATTPNHNLSSNNGLSSNTIAISNTPTSFSTTSQNATLPGVSLRILPLGDSITWGYKSTTGNGYRQDLLDLVPNHTVNYVGTQRSGNMTDPNNEGHPGAVISQMLGFCEGIEDRPNVVLLMAGTNDMSNVDVSGAPARLSTLIDNLVIYFPESVLLVAELTPIADDTVEANVKKFNAAIPRIVAEKQALDEKVLAVNMSAQVSMSDLEDGVHPNDRGYQLMANVWMGGLNAAATRGWLSQPLVAVT